ncbi:hypothetical protein BK715_22865 [Bacillus thuringiensis serovar japonensis]|nr:hypothetical protein BK713_09805 [Bacillus thuringiensis serovar jinghongiensis]OTX13012.1 hypothetical protein BK715_22865 [Bacillus thuringiensis serovar japonensis]PDY64310.1 hypothetical protein COM88_16700 [Bacillus cereus]
MRSSLICELINFIFYCKILLRLYYSNTILKIQDFLYIFKKNKSKIESSSSTLLLFLLIVFVRIV